MARHLLILHLVGRPSLTRHNQHESSVASKSAVLITSTWESVMGSSGGSADVTCRSSARSLPGVSKVFILTFSFFFLFYMHDDDGSKSSVNSDEAFSKTFGSAWTRLIVVSVFCGGAVLTTKRTGSGCIAAVCMVRCDGEGRY